MIELLRSSRCGLALLLAACAATPPRGGPHAHDVLDRVRLAVGHEALLSASEVQVHGACREGTLEGEFERRFRPDGRYEQHVRTRLARSHGFDGSACWRTDSSGVTRTISLGAAERALVNDWWIDGLWLTRGSELTVDVDVDRSNVRDLVLEVGLGDASYRVRVVVARDSYLPRALVEERPGGQRTVTLEDWRTVHGFRYPHRITVERDGARVARYDVAEVRTGSPREAFLTGASLTSDSVFDPAASPRLAVRRGERGHVLVRPELDGEARGWFLLDSGAGMNCVDTRLARELGWPAFGQVSVVGVAGAVEGAFRQGGTLRLGPLATSGQPWLEADLAPLEDVVGEPLAGLLGYDLFARAVVVLDLASGLLELHEPRTFELPDGAWQDLVFDDTAPCAEARFADEHSGWFRLDTGSSDTVAFHAPVVRAHRMTAGRYDLRRVNLGGLGGSLSGLRGELPWFELGGVRFLRPEVTFAADGGGAFESERPAGNVGAGLLQSFRVVFDYSRARVAFLPSENS